MSPSVHNCAESTAELQLSINEFQKISVLTPAPTPRATYHKKRPTPHPSPGKTRCLGRARRNMNTPSRSKLRLCTRYFKAEREIPAHAHKAEPHLFSAAGQRRSAMRSRTPWHRRARGRPAVSTQPPDRWKRLTNTYPPDCRPTCALPLVEPAER